MANARSKRACFWRAYHRGHLIPESYPVYQAVPRALAARLQNIQDALPHLPRFLAGIDSLPNARLAVVVRHGRSLVVVSFEALLQRIFVVVRSLDERLAGNVIRHFLLWGVEDLVVGSAGGGVDEAAGDAGHEQIVVDLQLDGVFERFLLDGEHAVKLFGLWDCAGETVEDETKGVGSACRRASIDKDGGVYELPLTANKSITHPFLHSELFSSSFLIMFTIISSDTRPP